MNTKFPYEVKLDLEAWLNEYWQQDDAVRVLPEKEELNELARKGIVKDQLVLVVILGELEAEMFIRLFKEQDGIDLHTQVPKEWEEDMNVHSLEEFIALRHDWYQMKIHQCLLYLNLLELPCEGKTDPLDHYEVLAELTSSV